MIGTDPALVPPMALVPRFRLDRSGRLTQLVDGSWHERSVGRALVWIRRSQRRRVLRIVLEIESVDVDTADVVARFRRQNVAVVEVGPRPFPSVSSSLLTAAIEGDWPDVEAQLAFGGDPAVRDAGGNSLLHYAAAVGSLELVRRLADEGVPVSWRNQAYRQAEDIARERGHHDVATWLACREVGRPERVRLSLWHRLGSGRGSAAAPVRFDGEHLTTSDGGRVAIDEVTALALSGPWSRRNLLVIGTNRGTPSTADALEDLPLDPGDRRELTKRATAFEVIQFDSFHLDLLAGLLPPLLERAVPVGRCAHRHLRHRGWEHVRLAAAPLRGRTSWRISTTPVPADPPPGAPEAVALYPSGHVGMRWLTFDGSRATTWTTVAGLLRSGRAMAAEGRPLTIDADASFPWVASVIARLRDTGVPLRFEPASGDETPPSLGDALLFHIGTGRWELAVDLIRAGWDVRESDPWNRSPLAYAVAAEATEVAERLLGAGADPRSPDDAGRTPASLASATWGPDHPLTRLLLDDR